MKHQPCPGSKPRAFFVIVVMWTALTGWSGRTFAGEVEADFSAGKDAAGIWTQELSLVVNLNWPEVWGGEVDAILEKEWPWGTSQQGTRQVTGRWKIRPEKTSRVGLEVNSQWEADEERLAGTAEFSQRLAAPGTRLGVGIAGEKLSDWAGSGDYHLWQWQGEMVYQGGTGGDLLGLTWLDNAVLFPWPGDREWMEVQDPASLMNLYVQWLVMDEPQEDGRVRIKKLSSYKEYSEKPSQSSSYDYGTVSVNQPWKNGWTVTANIEDYSRVYNGIDADSYETRKGQAGFQWKSPQGILSLEQGLTARRTRYLFAPEKNVTGYGVYAEGGWKVTKGIKMAWQSRLYLDQDSAARGRVRLDLGIRQTSINYGGFVRWTWEGSSETVWGIFAEAGGQESRIRLAGDISPTGEKNIKVGVSRSF